MEPRFIPLNAALALYSRTQTSWPRPLFEIGYWLEAIELPVNSGDGRVDADVVAHRRDTHRFVLTEAKSGANLDETQAQRYAQADPIWLVQATRITVGDAALSPQCQTHYICLRQHEDRILHGLSQAGVDFPVLSVGDDDIRHRGGRFDDPDVAAAFAQPLPVSGPPPGIITIDRDSPDADFDLYVQPSLVEAMAQGKSEVSVPDLAKSSIFHFDIYQSGYRNALIRKVEGAARRAAEADQQHFEYRPPTATRPYGMIRVRSNPEDLDRRGRTQAYQGIANRFRGGRRRSPAVNENQGVLFGSDDLSRELFKDDEGEEEA